MHRNMDMHINFVWWVQQLLPCPHAQFSAVNSSTNLDSWKLNQLARRDLARVHLSSSPSTPHPRRPRSQLASHSQTLYKYTVHDTRAALSPDIPSNATRARSGRHVCPHLLSQLVPSDFDAREMTPLTTTGVHTAPFNHSDHRRAPLGAISISIVLITSPSLPVRVHVELGLGWPPSCTNRPCTHALHHLFTCTYTPRSKISQPRPRPSLDRIAARSESLAAPAPHADETTRPVCTPPGQQPHHPLHLPQVHSCAT